MTRPLAALLAFAAALPAQEVPEPAVFRSSMEEVLVDLVVRDRRGRLIRDLRPEEIEILEDGVPQPLRSLIYLEGGSAEERSPGRPAARRALDPVRQVRLIVIALDSLSASSAALARQSLTAFLKDGIPANTYYAVARLEPRLRMEQGFTDDATLVRWAVERATGASAARSEAPALAGRTRMAGGELEQVLSSIEQRFAEADAARQSRQALESLWSLALGLRLLEGRKSVIFVSEGLGGTAASSPLYRNLTAQANRDNVAFYTLDARGLAAASPLDPAAPAAAPSSDAALQSLAAETGGFAVEGTNDFRSPLQRIHEEAASHYYAAYPPASRDWDGKFRAVEVRVKRPGARVQARNGYFALPPGMQALLFPHEIPLLKALSANPPPRQFPFRAGLYRFGPMPGGRLQAGFHIEVPIAELSVRRLEAEAAYETRAAFLVLIKDAQGRLVRKATRDVPFSGPLDRLDGFRAGNFIYDDYFPLAPGRYVLEAAVWDPLGERLSTRRVSFVLPAPDPASIALSSPLLVRRIEAGDAADVTYGAADDRGPNPFRFEGGKVTPTLDERAAGELAVYFVIYPAPGAAPPELFLEFYRDGERLSQSKPVLPPAGADGRIPYAAVTDISRFPPGGYELRIVARQGARAVEERLGFQALERTEPR